MRSLPATLALVVRARGGSLRGRHGVMLDIARHYEPPSAVQRLIDQAAADKIDVLHDRLPNPLLSRTGHDHSAHR